MIRVTDVLRIQEDLQASTPEIPLALSRAGVSGVQKAIRICRGDAQTVMAAVIDELGFDVELFADDLQSDEGWSDEDEGEPAPDGM